jgi:hypothetical protein
MARWWFVAVARQIVEAHSEWLDEVERQLGP